MHVPEVVKISPSFDFERIALFQRHCFGLDLTSPERWRLQCHSYYRWKYFTPAGPAWVASVHSKDSLLAMTAAVPFRVAAGSHQFRAWQICDIATHPQFREQGLFSKCLRALRETLGREIMFCFPNERSRRGLARMGFLVRDRLRVRARPVFFISKGESPIEFDLSALPSELHFASKTEPQLHVTRSAEFLRWRYNSHPVTKYSCIMMPTSSTMQGHIVVRIMDLVGLRLVLILESWPSSEIGLRLGINAALQWAKKNRCCAVLSAANQTTATSIIERFWSLRGWILPKSISFCATSGDPTLAHEISNTWTLQPGDWDAV
jgi:hypothetical protein